MDWIADFTAWLLGLVKAVFLALVTWVHDAALWAFDGILAGIAALITAIPAPAFLSNGANVGSMLSVMPSFTIYVIQQLNIGACLAVLSAGITFRLLRKAATAFQW